MLRCAPFSQRAWIFWAIALLATLHYVQKKYDARVWPNQPSPETMVAILNGIAAPPSNKVVQDLKIESKDGRITYSKRFEATEPADEVALYYRKNLAEDGWVLVSSRRRLVAYEMKFCRGRLGVQIDISSLEHSSSYSLSAVWSHYPDDPSYCKS